MWSSLVLYISMRSSTSCSTLFWFTGIMLVLSNWFGGGDRSILPGGFSELSPTRHRSQFQSLFSTSSSTPAQRKWYQLSQLSHWTQLCSVPIAFFFHILQTFLLISVYFWRLCKLGVRQNCSCVRNFWGFVVSVYIYVFLT